MRIRHWVLVLLASLAAGVATWRLLPRVPNETPADGGALVATIRSEPRSFNRLVARDVTSHLVSVLAHARLVKLNLATQDVEPALAERWDLSADGRTYTFHLRQGITFSDGQPFTARDVAFTFRAVADPKVGSSLSALLQVKGQDPLVAVRDEHTVSIEFAAPFAPALRVLDAIPILPAHKLEAAYAAGLFRNAWNLTTPPSEMAGLGPFVLRSYEPGVRLVFERNPRYWKRDAAGPLPRLARLTLDVVPNQNAEMLRLDSGEADLVSSEARAEDIAALRTAAQQGRLRLEDAGVGLDPDMFWINLRPDAPYLADRPWLARPELREALSLGIDRQAFVNVVYLGAGVIVDSSITPGNKKWFDGTRRAPAYDPARAATLLEGLGLVDRNGDGWREAGDGVPARIVLATQKGNAVRERAATFIQAEIKKLGIGVDLVAMETGALADLIDSGKYEATLFGTVALDTDPGTHLDFWLSSGSFHVWHLGQATPSTDWERRIDDAMQQMVTTLDFEQRRRIFAEVRREFDAMRPVIYLAAPRVFVPMSTRVGNARPALLRPAVLWDAEHLTATRGR